MTDNENVNQIAFEVKAECFKESVKEYFSRYKNDSGAEDRIEICLIRHGYRAVLSAEEEINRQNAEIERLKTNLNIELENYATEYDNKIKSEAYREFAELLKCDWIANLYYCEDLDITDWIDNILKELVGDDDG